MFEYTAMLNLEGEAPANNHAVDIARANVRRAGKDISIITYGPGVYKALDAALELDASGIDAEVLDLRVLRPLDETAITDSVSKTHKVLIVEEASRSVSISSEVTARIIEKCFYELDAPIQRLCGVEVPIPYPRHLEEASIPQKNQIVSTVKKMLKR
jgi:pyruvate dehydrogenase E1 component beta subunit